MQEDESYFEELSERLQSNYYKTRRGAIEELVELDEPGWDVVSLLLHALRDEDEEVRGDAIYELGEINDLRAFEPLKTSLLDRSFHNRASAVIALSKFGEVALKPLLEALGDETSIVLETIARVISEAGLSGINALITVLYSPDKPRQRDAAFCLSSIRNSIIIEPLRQILLDKTQDDEVRYWSVIALEQFDKAKVSL